ncbi:MAG: hypothetical protein WC789_14585 [Lentisphaeria bacterium]
MPILNYTTKIHSAKTVGEIQHILARAGARSINIDYDDHAQPVAVTFLVNVTGRLVNFRLPSNWRGVWARLRDDPAVPRNLRTEEQSRRVAWRIVKDWCEAQMAIIDSGLAELTEVFLPYAVNPESGQTLFQEFQASKLLTAGDDQ